MNTRRGRIDKILDKWDRELKISFWIFCTILVTGFVRAVAFMYGANLVQHWFDKPAVWMLRIILG